MIDALVMTGGIVGLLVLCFAFAWLLDSTYPQCDRGLVSMNVPPPKGSDLPLWVYDEHGDLVPGPPPEPPA